MGKSFPGPEALARRDEVEMILGKVSAMAAQENNVYVTSDIEALQDELLDRFNELGENND